MLVIWFVHYTKFLKVDVLPLQKIHNTYIHTYIHTYILLIINMLWLSMLGHTYTSKHVDTFLIGLFQISTTWAMSILIVYVIVSILLIWLPRKPAKTAMFWLHNLITTHDLITTTSIYTERGHSRLSENV